MSKDRAKKALRKKAKKGFGGYPVATVAFYGPTDRKATKLVVSIVAYEGADPEPMRKWFSDADVRNDPALLEEALTFIRTHEARSVVMTEGIMGCPHEEGIDYPEGDSCPQCPFWKGRNRWAAFGSH